MPTIYFVEDEIDLSNLVIKYLSKEGYQTVLFTNGDEAMQHVADAVDLWILDIMLPGSINGYDLIKEIRLKQKNMPVIFTSARDEDIDRVLGLELGGDDYISKPYSLRELMLRIKNILTRVNPNNNDSICYGPYTINPSAREITEGNNPIQLTSKEYDLLYFFISNKGNVYNRDEILKAVWSDCYDGSARVVDDLMRRLRKKMPLLRIETVYGLGYRLL